MAATELTGEEALAEQAGTAFAEGNCAQALELLVQLQKLREDGALLLPPHRPFRNPAGCGDRAGGVGVGGSGGLCKHVVWRGEEVIVYLVREWQSYGIGDVHCV